VIDEPNGISLLDLSYALSMPFRSTIEEIAGESYANASVLLEQEYEKNNKIYIHRDQSGQPNAFFMVGWRKVDGIDGHTVFLGLSSVSNRAKSMGLGKRLYQRFLNDATEVVRSTGVPVTWWFHTATPVVANAFWKISNDTTPRPDGGFTESDRHRIEVIKEAYGILGNHPKPAIDNHFKTGHREAA
jgi:hypothetical protein